MEKSRKSEAACVQICQVTKCFGEDLVLKEVNLTLNCGQVYGIVGNNGSGKTVLMKCICGFVLPTKGAVLSNGKKIGKDMDYLQDAGVIIETPGFISYYSGLKNLKLLAGLNGKKDTAHLSRVMELCGLDPGLRLPVRKYSLGMRQRLGIAQAIMEDQKYLILDEPMNGLDKQGVEDVRKLLLQLKEQGKLILIASHNKADIDILCDEVYEMESGTMKRIV